jgi:hypothetical protein
MNLRFRAWHRKERRMYYRAYQKWFHVLLCAEDPRDPGGPGIPVLRARFEDCDLLQGTGVFDKMSREIFEGDIVRLESGGRSAVGVVPPVPDMYKSRRLHPLQGLLEACGMTREDETPEFEVMGNRYETSESCARD